MRIDILIPSQFFDFLGKHLPTLHCHLNHWAVVTLAVNHNPKTENEKFVSSAFVFKP
jgi:hypothetical protein